MHEVIWDQRIISEFVKEALLSEDEEFILKTRASGWSRVKQADALKMSVSNIDKIIKRLRLKYDQVAKYSDALPPRQRFRWF